MAYVEEGLSFLLLIRGCLLFVRYGDVIFSHYFFMCLGYIPLDSFLHTSGFLGMYV